MFAGPPCSGKSTVLYRLHMEKLPHVARKLGLGDVPDWKLIFARKLHQCRDRKIDCVLFHYDILRKWRGNLFPHAFERDPSLRILNSAHEIIFVTLWASPDVLAQRFLSRFQSRFALRKRPVLRLLKSRDFAGMARGMLKHLVIHRLYMDEPALLSQYEKWFRFCEKHDAQTHWIMDTTEAVPRMLPLSSWPIVQGIGIPDAVTIGNSGIRMP